MVTYCIGSARQKRAYFTRRSAVMLDNVEVVFCADVDGKNCFAYGVVPFSEFTVRSYLKYKTALVGGVADDVIARIPGINPNKRIGKLCPAQMRCVQLLEKLAAGRAVGDVVINLDGARYSRKNAKYLAALLLVCENAFVCVTDNRFVSHADRAHKIMQFGKPCKTRRAFYRARLLARLCENKFGVAVTKVGVM